MIGARARSLGPDHFLSTTQSGRRVGGWPGGKYITAGALGRSEKYVEAGGRFLPHERNIFSSGDPWARRGIYFTRHEPERAAAQGDYSMVNGEKSTAYQRGGKTSGYRHKDGDLKTLRRHRKLGLPETMCPGERPFTCSHCSETFRSEPGMKLHIRDNHKEDE